MLEVNLPIMSNIAFIEYDFSRRRKRLLFPEPATLGTKNIVQRPIQQQSDLIDRHSNARLSSVARLSQEVPLPSIADVSGRLTKPESTRREPSPLTTMHFPSVLRADARRRTRLLEQSRSYERDAQATPPTKKRNCWP